MSLRLPSPCFWRRDRDRYDASSLSIPLSRDDSDVETPRSWVPSQLGSLAAGFPRSWDGQETQQRLLYVELPNRPSCGRAASRKSTIYI